MKKFFSILLIFVLAFSLAGCKEEEEGYVRPDVLEVQLIPSRDMETLEAQRQPLEDLLEAALEMEVNVTVATDYNALIEGMAAGKIHVGFLASTAYVLAADEGHAEVILKSLRYEVDDSGAKMTEDPLVDYYVSQLLVAADSGITGVEDLDGKTIAISSFTSTSGFVWPANLLADAGMDVENDVTWVNSAGHDLAIIAILNGSADAAFTFKDARFLVADEYPDVYEDVLFLQDTTAIPNDTISVMTNLDPYLVQAIKLAFLSIAGNEESLTVLRDIYSHEGLVTALDSDYDVVREYLERQKAWSFE